MISPSSFHSFGGQSPHSPRMVFFAEKGSPRFFAFSSFKSQDLLPSFHLQFLPLPSPSSPRRHRACTYLYDYIHTRFLDLACPTLLCTYAHEFPRSRKRKGFVFRNYRLSPPLLFPPCMRLAVSAPVDKVAWFLVRFGWHERRERDEEIIPRSPSRSTKGVHPPQNGRREGGGLHLNWFPPSPPFVHEFFCAKNSPPQWKKRSKKGEGGNAL